MSRIDDASKRLSKIENEAAKLEADFDRAQAERAQIETRRLTVDRALADGTAGADALFDGLDRDDRKLAARLRGIVLKRVEVREAVNVAREERRGLQAIENDAEAVRLRARIAEVEATISPMRSRLRDLRSGYASSSDLAPRERKRDEAALEMLRFQAAAVLEVTNGAR